MTGNRMAAIILAAGYSSRMGRFKPLIRLNDLTIAERLIGLYQSSGIDTFMVAGWKSNELRQALRVTPFQWVENPDFAEGMFSSIRAGVRVIQDLAYRSFFVQPVDVPLIRLHTIRSLAEAGSLESERIIYPVFGRRRGHPPLIPLSLAGAIVEWQGEGGLRGFLKTSNSPDREITLPDSNILFDIDTPDTLPELYRRFASLALPGREECSFILSDLCQVPEPIQKHCTAVAGLAEAIARALLPSGVEVNVELVRAAAQLHDLAKGRAQHEKAAALVLREMGFPEVAAIVENHTELGDWRSFNLETRVVFLADKMVREDRRIELSERYDLARRKFGHSAEALAKIDRRQAEAMAVKVDLESRLGYALDRIVLTHD